MSHNMPLDKVKKGEDDVLSAPANVSAKSPGPVEVETLPPDKEPQAATDEALEESSERADAVEEVAEEQPLPEFDPRYRDPFEGCMYLGKITREFQYVGHTFVIKSLTVDEVLETGILALPYVGSLAEMKAYQAAVVAACLVSVDGRPLPMPITSIPGDTMLVNRFHYVRDHWFFPVLDRIYQEYLLLESQVSEVMQALGEAFG